MNSYSFARVALCALALAAACGGSGEALCPLSTDSGDHHAPA